MCVRREGKDVPIAGKPLERGGGEGKGGGTNCWKVSTKGSTAWVLPCLACSYVFASNPNTRRRPAGKGGGVMEWIRVRRTVYFFHRTSLIDPVDGVGGHSSPLFHRPTHPLVHNVRSRLHPPSPPIHTMAKVRQHAMHRLHDGDGGQAVRVAYRGKGHNYNKPAARRLKASSDHGRRPA